MRCGSAGYITLKQVLVLACGVWVFGCIVLWPATRSGDRPKAKQAACISNIRQLGRATGMYVQDYDEYYPPADRWQTVIVPYCKDERLFTCPSRPETVGYAYNWVLDAMPAERIEYPDRQPMYFDSDRGVPNSADLLTSFARPHLGGGNLGYADGHVKFVRQPPPADVGLRQRLASSSGAVPAGLVRADHWPQ